MGFLFSFNLCLGKGRMKALSLTEKGKKALGINDGESNRQGGPEHRYWVRAIAERLKTQGYEVAEEVAIGSGKTIDLLASRNGKRIAFEIETGKSDAVANVRKCFEAGIEKIVIVATSPQVRDRLTAILSKEERVKLLTASDLLRQDYS